MRRTKTRIRRSLALILQWEPSYLRASNYISGRTSKVSPELVPLLDAFVGYAPRSLLQGSGRSSEQLIQRLIANDILVEEGSELALREELLHAQWSWDSAARHFHFATNAVEFEANDEAVWGALERKSETSPPPSPFREYEGHYGVLPSPLTPAMPLGEALRRRRTCRAFDRAPLSLLELSTVIGLTWGVSSIAPAGQSLGDFVLKTSPSGGARHPTEVYLFASRIEGLAPGIYHYSPRLHALHALSAEEPSRLAAALCAQQQWVGDAAASFFMTSLVSRTMWKYGHSHAYRVLLLDAGHLGQTFHLVCTALGLGPFTTAAFDGSAVERALGLDGINEIAIYAGAVGRPSREPG
jgi:SagB-type dehydrogenase family enzyme